MTLSEPSFLAAATSASMPPASSVDLAVAASPPEPPSAPLSLAGGAQAARAATPIAATSESRRVLLVMRPPFARRHVCRDRASPCHHIARRPTFTAQPTQLFATRAYRRAKF